MIKSAMNTHKRHINALFSLTALLLFGGVTIRNLVLWKSVDLKKLLAERIRDSFWSKMHTVMPPLRFTTPTTLQSFL